MPVYEAPDDDDDRIRQSYNVAPGYYEPVYRAVVPDRGVGSAPQDRQESEADETQQGTTEDRGNGVEEKSSKEVRYKLQAMKWGQSHSKFHEQYQEQEMLLCRLV